MIVFGLPEGPVDVRLVDGDPRLNTAGHRVLLPLSRVACPTKCRTYTAESQASSVRAGRSRVSPRSEPSPATFDTMRSGSREADVSGGGVRREG